MDEILERLKIIEEHILDRNIIVKNVFNFNETCKFLELSQSHLYKLSAPTLTLHYYYYTYFKQPLYYLVIIFRLTRVYII